MSLYFYELRPTIGPVEPFDAAEDGDVLRSAMKGFGTDEKTLIEILTRRSSDQRQDIRAYFDETLGRDLIKDLKKELSGKFEDVMVGLTRPPHEFLCKQLHKAMEGAGTDESALIEVICSKSNEEIQLLNDTYAWMYERPLVEHICDETSGELRRFLTYILTLCRNESEEVDFDRSREIAEQLYAAGEGRFGTDENYFTKVLSHESFPQLHQIFADYKEVTGNTIEQALNSELSGNLLDAFLAVVECVQSPPTYFAKRLRDAMHGAGTDDETLIRIIVSRCEIDLGNIKEEYERMYNKTLESKIKDECSGDYKKALLSLVEGVY